MQISFEPLTENDVPLLTRWLQESHVRAFWDGGERDESAVRAHYFRVGRDVPGFVFSMDGRPAGFLQTERITSEHEFWPWATPKVGTWAIDLLIGEAESTGQGLGPAVIRAFVERLSTEHPDLRHIVVDPDARNIRAIRAYAKAGFQKVRTLNGLTGPIQIMQLNVGPEGVVSVRDELSAAIERADSSAIQQMLESNALSHDDLGRGLAWSVTAEDVTLINLFLDHGADPNYEPPDYSYLSAVCLASDGALAEVIRAIFSRGGDPNTVFLGGATPLFLTIETLAHVRHHVLDDAEWKKLTPALIEALKEANNLGNIESVKALVESGAKPDVYWEEASMTPVQFARGLGLENVAAYLEDVINQRRAD